jgi:hypothetical protein|tara:strand:- start:18837 stop:18998 length:162 start_codon:yes stop_codon:yes gene_type:complete
LGLDFTLAADALTLMDFTIPAQIYFYLDKWGAGQAGNVVEKLKAKTAKEFSAG